MGFDIVHFNLHKTFTQPHGGGGPGSGPIAVSDRIEPYLMVPRVVRGEDGSFDLARGAASTSRSAACAASRATTARSCAPTPTSARWAPTGLKEMSETAVLNANYLLARLRETGVGEHLPPPTAALHARVRALRRAEKRELGVKTLDLAKRMLDFGYHPPTVYFPLLVDEALLVEPTETESKETLDGFADAVAAILREAAQDPEIARNAPYTTPVRRLDEAGAAKRPQIRAVAPG